MEFFQFIPAWPSHGEDYWRLGLFVLVGGLFPTLSSLFYFCIRQRSGTKKSATSEASAEKVFSRQEGVFREKTNNRIFGISIHASFLFCFILLLIPMLPFLGEIIYQTQTLKNGGNGIAENYSINLVFFIVFLLLVFLLAVFFGIKRGLFEWLDPPRA